MKNKFAYTILECKLYCSTIFLLILIGLVDIVQLAAERTTRECAPENPLCEHCVIANKSLCRRCKNITMCSDASNYYVTCLTECPKDMYYNKMKEQRACCQSCHEGCLNGCTGKEPYLGKNGCNKCKYAFMEDDGRLRCWKFSDGGNVCTQISPGNYYPKENQASTKMEFECRKCHKNCRSCTSDGNDYELDECRCAKGTELTKEYRNNKTANVCTSIMEFRKSPDISEIFTQNPIISKASKTNNPFILSSERSLLSPFSGDNSQKTYIIIAVLVIVTMVPLMGVLLILVVMKYFAKSGLKKSSNLERNSSNLSDQLPSTSNIQPLSSTDPLIGPSSHRLKLNLHDVERMPLNRSISQPSSVISQSPVQQAGNGGNTLFPAPRQSIVTNASSTTKHNKMNIINKKQINVIRKINEGQFGEVYEGMYNNQNVAIKMLKIRNTSSINEAIEESTFMAKHTFPHLQKLIGICPIDGGWIISELRIGNLKDYLKNNRYCLTVRNLSLFSAQIAAAIEFLHIRKKYHGDLAARNVLVKNINHVEVGDFGLSRALKRGQTGYKSNGKAAFRWMSPECLRSWVFDMANDVWAFGVTCWEIFTFGKLPYEGVNLTSNHDKRIHLENLENGTRLVQTPEIECLDAYSIMLKCWTYPPEGRIKIKEAKEAFEGLLHDLDPSYISLGPDVLL